MSCERAMDRIDRMLDGDRLPVAEREALELHLAACARCRARREELGAVQTALRELPLQPLPEMALERVWRQTSRARRPAPSEKPRRSRHWRFAAAAAAVGVIALGSWHLHQREIDRAETRRAATEARFVFKLTADALRRSETIAVRGVMSELSPALSRVPVLWPRDDRSASKQTSQETLP